MKTNIAIYIFLFTILTFSIYPQEMQDVIHLKNGDILKGLIIENAPNDYLRIELQGGSVLTVHYSDISKFTKERTKTIEKPKTQESTKVEKKFDAEKSMYYEQEKKSNGTAVLFSILLTSTGHAYAGNWGRGLLFTAARVGGIALALTAGFEYDYNYSNEITPWLYIGVGVALAATVWEVIDASGEVDRYNKKLYNRIMGNQFSFDVRPDKYGAKLQFRYNF